MYSSHVVHLIALSSCCIYSDTDDEIKSLLTSSSPTPRLRHSSRSRSVLSRMSRKRFVSRSMAPSSIQALRSADDWRIEL